MAFLSGVRRNILWYIVITCSFLSFSFKGTAGPEVPSKIDFAGISLTIHSDARLEMQKDVDMLTKSPKYFNIKVERARIYFPIIESIFREENIPLDFMFLVLQESALIPDAVSTSNAVGYWQFKAETAGDFGLEISDKVDERMNIASATRAAAQYFKKSNSFFDNWVLVVQSYNMGIGGTRRLVGEQFNGVRRMEINMETNWYVRKFLAHKVAFEDSWKGTPPVRLRVVPVSAELPLHEISRRAGVDHELLRAYNMWAKADAVPGGKVYHVLVPGDRPADFSDLHKVPETTKPASTTVVASAPTIANGLKILRARKGETLAALAVRAQVDVDKLMTWNDYNPTRKIGEGDFFYLEPKFRSSSAGSHTANGKESLWDISQKYGVRLRKVRAYNRDLPDGVLKSGTLVALSRSTRSASHSGQPVLLDSNNRFEWNATQKQ